MVKVKMSPDPCKYDLCKKDTCSGGECFTCCPIFTILYKY